MTILDGDFNYCGDLERVDAEMAIRDVTDRPDLLFSFLPLSTYEASSVSISFVDPSPVDFTSLVSTSYAEHCSELNEVQHLLDSSSPTDSACSCFNNASCDSKTGECSCPSDYEGPFCKYISQDSLTLSSHIETKINQLALQIDSLSAWSLMSSLELLTSVFEALTLQSA